jgi:hypothetical protein
MGILVAGITRRRSRPSNWSLPDEGGPTPDFGPTPGEDAVRTATAPLAVTHPGGSPVTVNPGDSVSTISSKITQAGTGGTLWFNKGTYNLTASIVPLAGQTWVLEGAAGYSRTAANSAVLTGNDGSMIALIQSSAANVTIRGGVLEHQGNDVNGTIGAALLHTGGAGGWLVQDLISRNNFNRAMNFQGPNNTARRVYMHNNGRYGPNVTDSGAAEDYAGNVFEKCRWSFNNERQLDTGAAAGGSKFVHAPGIVIRECWVHDNWGAGIWCDFVNNQIGGAQYIDNVVEHNRLNGMFLEGVWGGCAILRNFVYNNGYDPTAVAGVSPQITNRVQIRITNSDSTLGTGVRGRVENNLVDFDLAQSSVLGAALLLWNHNGQPNDVKNWTVNNNLFRFRDTANNLRIGGRDTKDTGTQLWAGNNFFGDSNHYEVASLSAAYWQWGSGSDTGTEPTDTWATWQGFGFDGQGTRTLI